MSKKIKTIDQIINTHRTIDVYIDGLFVAQSTGDDSGAFWSKILCKFVKITQASNTDRKMIVRFGYNELQVEAPKLDFDTEPCPIISQKIKNFIEKINDWKNKVDTFPEEYVFDVN